MAQYEEVAKDIIDGLKENLDFFDTNNYYELVERLGGLKEAINESKKEGRVLRIGIVGEVKAGKSSFLNALVFNGEDVLPKAATPMTAALTKISYEKKPSAKIVFYSRDDWDIIDKYSDSYDEQMDKLFEQYKTDRRKAKKQEGFSKSNEQIELTEELKKYLEKYLSEKILSCKELTQMVDELNCKGTDILSLLGKEIELSESEMKNGLENYIGANGKYTPIVKHVELMVNNEELMGIEIVDTPGMNDPVLSRGQITKRFLKKCDAIFLLSYCGQFLTEQDVNFMREILPSEGIKEAIIVGSKLDAGMLDEKTDSFVKAYKKSMSLYNKQAEANITKCIKEKPNDETLRSLLQSLPPSYVSAHLYNCAKKIQSSKKLNDAEKHTIRQFEQRFSDFKSDAKVLLSLSGISSVKKEKIIPVIKKKSEIINEKNRTLLMSNKANLLKLLNNIEEECIRNQKSLRDDDYEVLQQKFDETKEIMRSVSPKLRTVFDSAAIDVERFVNELNVDIDLSKDNFQELNITTRNEYNTHTTGMLFWKKEHVTTIIHNVASINDVIQNLERYIGTCKKKINEDFSEVLNKEKLQRHILAAIKGALDLQNKSFDPEQIIANIVISIDRVTIPKIDIEIEPYESKIVSEVGKFYQGGTLWWKMSGKQSSTTVEDEQIKDLQLLQSRVLRNVSKDVQKNVDKMASGIVEELKQQGLCFTNQIIDDVEKRVNMLQGQLNDKEKNLKIYEELIKKIGTYKKMVKEMEL